MDFNTLLLPAMMLYGRYDTKEGVHHSRLRIIVGRFLAFVLFFCSLKTIFIICLSFGSPGIVFYLVEFYILNSDLQIYFFVAVANVHMHIAFIYLYWGWLCEDTSRMRCIDFLFMPTVNELCLKYKLDHKSAKRFVWKVEIYKKLFFVVLIGFEVSFQLLVIRCLALSYSRISFEHFLYIALPMGLITMFCNVFLGLGFLITYLMALISIDFLSLRVLTLSNRIRRKFVGLTGYRPERNRLILSKRGKAMSETLETIDDIVIAFKKSNRIFDNLVSATFVNCLLGGLLFPAFIFLDIPLYFKCVSMFLYVITITNNCFLITVFNGRFITNINGLASTIHSVLPLFEGFDLKNSLSNFLLLNGRHRRLSFTYFYHFDYSSQSLIEYLVHSLSMVLMIYQAIWTGGNSKPLLKNLTN